MLNMILLAAAIAAPWGGLKMPEGENLLSNPAMHEGTNGKPASWQIFSPGLKVTFPEVGGRKITRFTTTGDKYHYGPVINLAQLKAGHRYKLALLAKGTLTGQKSRCEVFYYEGSKKGSDGRILAGGNCRRPSNTSFPWNCYTMTFETPADYSGSMKFYPFLLTGTCDIMVAEAGVYDLGPVQKKVE